MKITVIDNYDSFVYNLCDYIDREKSVELKVYRNDKVSVEEVLTGRPDGIVISPGPGRPEEAGISVELIKKIPASIVFFGVCLGHQAMAVAYGGKVVKAKRILHGKTSRVTYTKSRLFKGIENPFEATRYHSLIVEGSSLPSCLEVTATASRDEIMAMEHKSKPRYGVQFHPESILTGEGLKIVNNFLDITRKKMKDE
ncbi:MAG: aminodeoxychorismate/anthranilate synthase component II [Elusimicrobiota bacterium]|nr:aminodeoxychorismate/anthranilate synthase component II [Elusimicrobiota bacterium]